MKLHKKIAHLFGYDLIRKNGSHLELEDHLAKILKRYTIDCVIDVGANEGQFYKLIRKTKYHQKIISVEPIPELVKKCETYKLKDQNYTIYNTAVGEEESQLELNVFESSVFSSFRELSAFSKEYFPEHTKLNKKINVSVKRLDQLLVDEIKDFKNIFLKIDTQGFDLEAYRGAAGMMNKVSALLIECSVVPIYTGNTSYADTLKYFESEGFIPSGFFPVSRNSNNLGLIEFDVVMIRK